MKPSCTPSQADGFINRRVRNSLDVHSWSDLVKVGMIVTPEAYSTGTVSFTQASNQVVGVATAWPINDRINAVSTQPIVDSPGFVEIFPTAAEISKIRPGSLLLLDQENASVTEILTVQSVGPTSFTAYCRYAHDQSVTLQQSSLAGQQIAAATYTYTVQAVLTATLLHTDMLFGGPAQSGVSYSIRQQFNIITPTARRLLDAYDAIAGNTIGTLKTVEWLNLYDPQRSSTGNPLELVNTNPAPGGVMQWEVWPWQTSQYGIGVLYADGWPTLYYDTDILPPFMNPEMFIAGALGDALLTKNIPKENRVDPYYDPVAAKYWLGEHARLEEMALQSDYGRRNTALTNWKEMLRSPNYNWMRAHAISAGGAGWGGW